MPNLFSRVLEGISARGIPGRPVYHGDVFEKAQSEYVLFFSLCDGLKRAKVINVRGRTFQAAWRRGVQACQAWIGQNGLDLKWLRVDWVTSIESVGWLQFNQNLKYIKRNYFRFGIAWDSNFEWALLEQELNANAILYGGPSVDAACFNLHNLMQYAQIRFDGKLPPQFSSLSTARSTDDHSDILVFSTDAFFVSDDLSPCAEFLPGPQVPCSNWRDRSVLNSGRRAVPNLTADVVLDLVRSGGQFLAAQVQESGQFVYGHFPCFGRPIPTYNSLRHASSVYALLEAFEITRIESLLQAAECGLKYLIAERIRSYFLPNGQVAAFLIDANHEIKVGGNAVCILAIVKYTELTGSSHYLGLLERLATGIVHMQDQESGRFTHVLDSRNLAVKHEFRIIYYDGEAAFGLMRLHGLTKDPKWLAAVVKAFDYFLMAEHWKAHDHWLSYCVNELSLCKPEEKYFQFGLKNISGYLDFIQQRETTFPTLLELCMAFEQMLIRIKTRPDHAMLLKDFDEGKFHQAMMQRANHLLNGFFWPEFAMFFEKPATIVSSFFIRHHSFRVRIDDVEHYLSGYVALWKKLSRD